MSGRGPSGGPGEDPAFESWLRRFALVVAEPSFRGRLRCLFQGESGFEPGEESRADAGVRRSSAVTKEVEDWLSGVRPAAPAGKRSRDALRRAFLGEQAATGGGRPGPSRARLVWVSLSAVAAILVITFFLPRETRWKVLDLRGKGALELTSGSLDPGERSRLSEELARGTRLVTGEQELTFSLAGVLAIRLLPHSRVRFESLPELGTAEPLSFGLESGELFLRTSRGYPGNPIRVETGEVLVGASGTAFGVLVDERGTCVCVCHGEVSVRGAGGIPEEKRVSAETSYLVFRSGGMAPKEMPFAGSEDPAHRQHTNLLVEFASAGER